MIVGRYEGKDGEHIHIILAENGKYFVNYGVRYTEKYNRFVHESSAGAFESESDALKVLKKHRPGCYESMNWEA